MKIDKNKYDIINEREGTEVFSVRYVAKERRCNICEKLKDRKFIDIINYPIMHKDMGRLVMRKKVCNECKDDVMEVLNNLNYN